ncbi:MAG: glycine--tRNA ligase subunit beta [Cyanobium sp.]
MAFFLLEIGTEELPADFARLALPQLEDQVRKDLLRSSLSVDRLQVTSTPRRLAVLVEGLPARQADLEEEHKGPPALQAFRDGVPTPAAEGFAKRCGLPVEQLEVRETPKGPFLFGCTRQPGRATAEVLAELIPGWIWGLQGRRFMRWGEGENRFSRPVRWLVALLDEDIIPVDLPGCDPPIRSGRMSRGHRRNPEPVEIQVAASYISRLAEQDVQVDRSSRAAQIRSQLERAADRTGAQLDLPEALFEELVDLVEDPRVIEGAIEPSFLSLPPEVLCTVMRAHQRYVPLLVPEALRDPLALSAEGALLPRFLCVSNGHSEAEVTVIRGNERVLRARLADAAFFLRADHGVPSIDRREALSRVTFAEGLGTLRERTERLEWCTDVLLGELQLQPEVAQAARRAAHLCKHDLVSQMVGEFPELQGMMGAKYLLAEGEGRDVALAVCEHYLPRGAGDVLPGTAPGAVLALADRLELLLSIFSRGDRPTGSSDPYGLRRAANGALQLIWHQHWPINLGKILHRFAKEWQTIFPDRKSTIQSLADDLSDFFGQRWMSLMEEDGLAPDIVKAVGAASPPNGCLILRNPLQARDRAIFLQSLRSDGSLSAIQSVVQRSSRLADKGTLGREVLWPAQAVNQALFVKKSEADMFAVLESLAPLAENKTRYRELADSLRESAKVLEDFFDGADSVLVMCDQEALRKNRLNLLSVLRNQADMLVKFDLLEN